jgi:hypothetical protein
MPPFSSPQHELIEAPSRDKFLTILRVHLLPRIVARQAHDEHRAKRPLEYDVAGDIHQLLELGQTAYLPTLAALTHLLLWAWMRMDKEFREWMIREPHEWEWWEDVQGSIRCWQSARSIEWPSTPLNGPQRIIDAWLVSEETLVSILTDWYLLH